MSRLIRARGRPWRRRASAVAALAVGVPLLIGGCGDANGAASLTPDAPPSMTVTSAAFGPDVLPKQYTCDGAGVRPSIAWSGAPQGTKSFAVVVDDSAAPITPYIYWIAFDIPATATHIAARSLPPGVRQAKDSAGRAAYDPPCPRGQPHAYRFTVYALNRRISLPNGASTLAAWQAIAHAATARGRITVVAEPSG